MKYFKIRGDVVTAIISYLQKRPYDEVYQGISALSSLEPLDVETQEQVIPGKVAVPPIKKKDEDAVK